MSMVSCQEPALIDPLDLVVVDDDSLTLEIVAWICRGTNTRVKLFDDPQDALEHLRVDVPAILIADYYMPRHNGLEFLQHVVEHCELCTTDIYLCSAITPTQIQRDQLKKLGASYLDKAVICDKTALLSLINSNAMVARRLTRNA